MSGWSDRRAVFLGVVLVLGLGIPFLDYRIDDTYIFLRYARNLAAGDGPSFNPGEPVFGFSSPLWLLLLAGLARIGLGTVWAIKVLSLLCAAGSVVVMHRWVRVGFGAGAAAVAALAWSVNAWLIRWTASGMEAAAVTFLVLLALDAFERERVGASRAVWSALWLGLAALARPECALLVVLAIGAVALRAERGGLVRAATTAAIVALIIVPWLAYAQAAMGSVLPITGAAKGTVGLAFGLDPLRDIARIFVATSGVELLWIVLVVGAALVASRGVFLRPLRSSVSALLGSAHALPLGWLAGLIVFYVATGFDVLSRYALPVVPVVVAYGAVAVDRIAAGRLWAFALAATLGGTTIFVARIAAAAAPAAVSASLALVLAVSGALLARRVYATRHLVILAAILIWNLSMLSFVVHPHTSAFGRGVTQCFRGLGEWFADNTPPDTQVAIADIGAFGYFSDRRVLDMAALVSPELLPLVEDHSIQEIAAGLLFHQIARPAFLIDRFSAPGRLEGALGGTFQVIEVEACAIHGLGVRSPETIYYTPYRLDWHRYEVWAASRAGSATEDH